ncbi:MAG: Nif11 domain/cupin domain-containing protein [Synechococcaceae cyanobacterium]|nr:Nif11 domain/cupin domain-containing protein [Synechococcaceae cyanobacterium]
MAEEQLQQFLEKVRQLNAFVARSEARPALRQRLAACASHAEVVQLARSEGFEIGRRWGEGEAPRAGGDGNLLAAACPPLGQEHTEVLLQAPGLRLERIHSCGAASPQGFWYEQGEHEWVLLLQGSARLTVEEEAGSTPVALSRGDSLLIPAGRRHRLEETDPAPGTIWLALFWGPAA